MVPNGVFKHVVKCVRRWAHTYGVRIQLVGTKRYLSGEVGSEAWYIPDEKLIQLATKGRTNGEVLMALLHEYGHAMQHVNHDVRWHDCFIVTSRKLVDASIILDEWVAGADYPQFIVDGAVSALYALEADAENRAINYAIVFGLSDFIDLGEYAQGANAYLRSYLYTKHTRKWCPANRPPYKVKSLLEGQPTMINVNYAPEEYFWLNNFIAVYGS